MSVLYHVTPPRPAVPDTDAVLQDVDALRSRFGGRVLHLYPFRRPGLPWPPVLFGLHGLPALRRRERTVTLHHLFAPYLYPYPLLRWLRRPVVYSVFASVQGQPSPDPAAFVGIARLVASSERDAALLRGWGLDRIRLIRPGIDLARFAPSFPPSGDAFVLLVGSAPWVHAQFRSKGIDALLGACRALPRLRLVFLWRGRLGTELDRRVRRAGVAERVEILDGPVDVPAILDRVHAAVVLADGPVLVKAYPHSLLEALAVGRPVLVSDVVPMADYVVETGCGEVVTGVDPLLLIQGLRRLIDGYAACQARAAVLGARAFSRETMLEAYAAVYREVASHGVGPGLPGRIRRGGPTPEDDATRRHEDPP